MMVQTAPEGEPHFVSTMREHLEFCGKLGRAFGNDRFERLDPYEEVIYVVENHDRGWDDYDVAPGNGSLHFFRNLFRGILTAHYFPIILMANDHSGA